MADDEIGDFGPMSPGLIKANDNIKKKLDVQSGLAIKSNADPEITFSDDDYDAQARAITEQYQAAESLKSSQFKSESSPPPANPDDPDAQTGIEMARNGINFLFHDEAAAIGVEWGRDHLNWSLDNARDFWSDHPWRGGLAMLSSGAPILAGARRLARAAKGADAAIDSGTLLERGLIDSIQEYDNLDAHAKTIIHGQANNIADIAELNGAVRDGTATAVQKSKSMFRQAFGNSYLDVQAMEKMQPYSTLKNWGDRVEELTTGKAVTGMLDMADNVPKGEGTAILHALKEPNQLKGLSNEGKLFALTYGAEARRMQNQLHAEGFIDDETAEKIGDIWFSTLRKDGKIFEEGPTTSVHSVIKRRTLDPEVEGSLRVVNIPRTSSAHLMERKLDSDGVTSLIKRQRAAEAIDADNAPRALKLLADVPENAEAIELIKNNRLDDAKSVLAKDGFIESNPKDLVVKSMLQQKLLFENFRTLRDVAMDPNLCKTFEEVQAMSSTTRNKMMNLNRLDNSTTLKRMIAKKLGKTTGGELGYVHESLFHALADSTNQKTIGHGVGLLEIGTAMLKTMKTSANPFTHLQNVLGNAVFLHMAGFNPLAGEHLGLLKKSFGAVNDWKIARRSGQSVAEVRDLGMLKSTLKGGADIDIAKEIQNPLLSGEHGILDMSSIEASEGIPMLHKLASQANDEQTLAKGLIAGIQKGSKAVGLDKASDMYMAEDSAMKFTYYLHLRQKGLNPLAAANEVSRRLPMYGSVGSAIQRGRKVLFPWASFPTEATRIMKNNIMDYPFRTAMWMHAPNLVQAPVAALSGMTYEEAEKRKEQNPMWAQKLTSVVSGLKDKNDDVRTFLMDMLPQSAIFPSTIAADASIRDQLPFGLGDPAPIITGFIDAMMGRGAFGQEIPTDPNSKAQKAFTILSSTIGLMMPPIVQKYIFNPVQPGIRPDIVPGGLPGFRAGQDIGLLKNPSTGKTGDWFYDAAMNNFLVKNYAGSAETEIGNSRFGQREASNYRGRLGREFSAWATSGSWGQAANTLKEVYSSFLSETPENPALAQQNYIDWQKLHAREILKNPSFRGLSREDFLKMLSKVGDSTAPVIDQAHKEYKDALVQGYVGARRDGKYDNSNPLTRAGRKGRSGRTGR